MRKANKKIKIFIDGHSFDKEFQGTQVYITELYRSLSEQYPDIDVYIGAANRENIQKALPFIREENILGYKKRTPGLLRYVTDIPALLKQHHFDFAHFQYIVPPLSLGCKYIVTVHDILFNDFKEDFPWTYRVSRNWLFRKSIQKAWLTTTVSDYSRNRIAFHYNIPHHTIHVLPSGVYTGFGERYTRSAATNHIARTYHIDNFILYVSRIEPRKNQLLLLKTFLELELFKRGISLVLIGNDSIRVNELHSTINNLSKEQAAYVHWLPQVCQEDLEAFYTCCRLFVYPSKAEGFGVPPLEAALCDAPVLCSAATAMQDFGFFDPFRFDIDNQTMFKEKLLQLLEHPAGEVDRNALKTKIKEQYSWKRTADNFYQLLNSKQL